MIFLPQINLWGRKITTSLLFVHPLVFLAVIGENEVLELDFDADPLLVRERGPDVVCLCHRRLLGLQQQLGLVHVHVHGAQHEHEAAEGRVGGDGLEPVVVQVEQHHLRLQRLQNQVAQLLNLPTTTTKTSFIQSSFHSAKTELEETPCLNLFLLFSRRLFP